MQQKRTKRSRNRAANKTAGHGSKKKNRGSGHRGGFGNAAGGKRSSAKLMKVTKGDKNFLGKHGFKSIEKDIRTINLQDLQDKLNTLLSKGMITKEKEFFTVDLDSLGYKKLLSKGSVHEKLNISVVSASETAVSKVEAAGGKVILRQVSEEVK
jgi:large subunit ribosomal protein L15